MAENLGKLQIVEIEDKEDALTLTFFHESAGEVRQVKLKKQRYDEATKKNVPDEEQYERYINNLKELLGVSEDEIETLIGLSFEVWESENYCSLYEPKTLAKFGEEEIGQIYTAEIEEIRVYDAKAQIILGYDGKRYGSNINWGNYVEALKKSLPNPQKKHKQLEKFEKNYHVKFEDRETLIGTDVMIEVKRNNMDSTGKNPTYIEVKALPKPKN